MTEDIVCGRPEGSVERGDDGWRNETESSDGKSLK